MNAPAGGGKPLPFGVPVADLSGAMLGAIAILGALVGRERGQSGRYLDVALLDGVLAWVAPLAGGAYFSGLEVKAGSHPLLGGQACFNVYETSDGRFLSLAALEPGFWGDFCKTVGRPAWIKRQFEQGMHAELTVLFRSRSREDWLALFEGLDACVEPVNSFEEALSHPQVRARGHVRLQDGKPVGMHSPFTFVPRQHSPAPRLGEHTGEILRAIGVSERELEDLRDRKVIAL